MGEVEFVEFHSVHANCIEDTFECCVVFGDNLPEIVDLLLLVTAGCGADGIGAVGVDLGVGMGCGVDALDDLEMGGGGVVVGDERWGCPILYV